MRVIGENTVEKYLSKRVKALKGETRKVAWVNRSHAPDRFVLLWGGHWVELKRPGKTARSGQQREHLRMMKHGVDVWVLDDIASVDAFLQHIEQEGKI